MALNVISSRFPIGVETIYKVLVSRFIIWKKKFVHNNLFINLFNSNLFASEDNKILKIGLLTPLSGEYRELGNSFLFSLQLALEEINDSKVTIIPRDSDLIIKKSLIWL